MKKTVSLLTAVVLLFSLCCASAPAGEGTEAERALPPAVRIPEECFTHWNTEAPALAALVEFVQAVTDEASPDHIPAEDRLAVFDLDGTLFGERFPASFETCLLARRILRDPAFAPDSEMLALGRELRESVKRGSFAEDLPARQAVQAARAYAGMTQAELSALAAGLLQCDADGFEGMRYADAFYLPMLDVVEYLGNNGFKICICSGGDRAVARAVAEGIPGISAENVFGADVICEPAGPAGDRPVRTDRPLGGDGQTDKALLLDRELGRQPVLSFGNDSGDIGMHRYTLSGNPYRSAAFMLLADDGQRDYGDADEAGALADCWAAEGFHVISVKNDFRTLYGDGVTKTDSFRWASELAETRLPVDPSPEWIGAVGEQLGARQLFIVAGIGRTTALVSLHEKGEDGVWKQLMTTPGYIGKNGLGKQAEGDGKTPVGVFSFNCAFGIAADPGCALPYYQVGHNDYWSGDRREGYRYNELVSLAEFPDLNTADSERIVDYPYQYQYCLNISYNEEGTPGLGSAIFLHSLGPFKPYTGGCVAIPMEHMLTVMQKVRPECVVVIDSLQNLSPETWEGLGY